jgi:hypothetical protein
VIEAMGAGRKAAAGMKRFLGLEPSGEPIFGLHQRNFVRIHA